MMNCYAFMGIQGSGKGTQAELVSSAVQYQHINIGDLFRNHIKNQTAIGTKVQEIILRGELVPDEMVFELVNGTIKADAKGIIFDGFPRTIAQAQYLIKHYNLLRVVYLDLSEQTAIERISARRICQNCHENYNLITQPPANVDVCDKCGNNLTIRNDDSPEAIQLRIQEYNKQTLPLKAFFEEQGILSVIHAENGIQEISKQIKELLTI